MRPVVVPPGTVVGAWTVIAQTGIEIACRCACGTEKIMRARDVTGRKPKSRSCGCQSGSLIRASKLRHGHTSNAATASRTYLSWSSMIQRCGNAANDRWPYYGGRGISVCDQWHAFTAFLADMGERPLGTTLDRINNDGNYEPSNCRWATPKQQANNRRPRTKRANAGEST